MAANLPLTITLPGRSQLTFPQFPTSFADLEQQICSFFEIQPPFRLLYKSEDGKAHLISSAETYAGATHSCPSDGLQVTLEAGPFQVATVHSGELLCFNIKTRLMKRLELPVFTDMCRVILYVNNGLLVTGCGAEMQDCYEVTSSWQLLPRPRLPASRNAHTMGLIGETAYLASGIEAGQLSKTVLALTEGAWRNVEPCLKKRKFASSVVVKGDWYIAGGWHTQNFKWKKVRDVERYRAGRGSGLSVKLLAPAPSLGLVWLRETTVLVCGESTYMLDLETGGTRECACPGQISFKSSGVVVQGIAYLLAEGEVWAYNCEENTWTSN